MQREAIEQEAIVQYCTLKRYPMFAIPNGGRRDAKEAMYLKRSGVQPGVPDMMFPVARHGKHGLFIELKVGRNKPTASQERWLEQLNKAGYLAKVCWGSAQAIELINWYFKGE
ncbi:MAG: VRR-NUC domain-containing protein [Clostridia bacterium]|nr:VRR-NUC domain-containing protein [Clostridia bacterium]